MNAPPQLRSQHAASKPATAKELLARGMEFHRAGLLADAGPCYDAAIRSDPRQSDALHLLGLVKSAEGDIERGIELIRQAVKIQPRFPAAFFNLGNLLRKQDKLQAAVTAYQRAIVLQRNFPEAYCNLGCTLDALGRLDEAAAAFRRAISDKRDYAEAHRNLGLVQHRQGRLDEAALALRRAVSLNPGHAGTHCELGRALQALHKFGEAVETFTRAAVINPHDFHTWLNLGICLHAAEKPAEAATAYRRAIALQPDFTEALRQLKVAITAAPLSPDIWQAQRDRLALNRESALAIENLGAALLLQGEVAQALDLWRQLAPLHMPARSVPRAEPLATVSHRLHTTMLQTATLSLRLDFKIIILARASAVTVLAPAFSSLSAGMTEAEALQQLDACLLKKASGPCVAAVHSSSPNPDLPAGPGNGRVHESIHVSIGDLSLFAQQLGSAGHHQEALECLREADRAGAQPRHFLPLHGLLAALHDCFDEAIGLYLKSLVAYISERNQAMPGTDYRARQQPTARLLEEALALYGAHPLPTPVDESCDPPAAPSQTTLLIEAEADALQTSPLLQAEACNYLAEDLLNHHNDLRRARTVYLLRDRFQQDWRHAHGIGSIDTLFLGFDWVRNIGHIAFLGHLIKLRELGLIPWRKIVVLAREHLIANRAYLDQWRPYVTVVTDPARVAYFEPLTIVCGFRFSTVFPFAGREPLYNSELAAAVEEKWDAAGRAPLLALNTTDKEAGWHALAAFGVQPGDWFVCLHVRESGFHQVQDEHRNAALSGYLPAIETITQRGGWVIRMGDATMSPMPARERVIDYPHTSLKSPAMDVFLCAECRFFIGLHSGLSHVPYSFGRPTVMTNWLNTGSLPPFPRNGLFLPKMIRDKTQQRLLPLREALGTEWGCRCYGACKLEDFGAVLVDNTAAEIDEIVLEMLARLDGTHTPSEEDAALQNQFSALFPGDSARGLARPGAAFLRRHRALL